LVAVAVLGIPILGTVAGVVQLCCYGISWTSILMLSVMYVLTVFGISIGYHRLASHNSFQTYPVVRAFFAILGLMTGQGPIFYWAALHRRHHATSDRPGDPHSPLGHGDGLRGFLLGLWHSHVGWPFALHANPLGVYSLTVAREHEYANWEHYIPDLLRDPLLVWVNRLYFLWLGLGLALPAAAAYALTGSWTEALLGLLWGGLVRIFLVQQATALIASIAHIIGTTPFRTQDDSRNSYLCALPTLGEWHNNHHAFPSSAVQGLRWWEIDVSAWLIHLMARLGLAWSVKVPNSRALEAARMK
jgi:stearoyl-CoA desaturase (delta-9 desaturase)